LISFTTAYFNDDCMPVSTVASRWHPRYADAQKLVFQRMRTVLGARDLTVSSAVNWNSLYADLEFFSHNFVTYT